MERSRAEEMTRLLNLYAQGDQGVEQALLDAVYDELHRLADGHMRGQAAGHTLQPTALIHEAWVRLVNQEGLAFDGREKFFQLASKVMRSVLVDHARRASRQKRGGGERPVALDDAEAAPLEAGALSVHDLLDLEEGLARLEEIEPQLARIVEMRFFGGLGHPQISRELGVPLRTIEHRWRTARAWLHAHLSR